MKNLMKDIEKYEKKEISDVELLSKLFSDLKERDLPYFLSSMFTKSEIKSFANRLLIIKKIKEEKNQHVIAGEIGVGVETISRGVKELKKGKFKFV